MLISCGKCLARFNSDLELQQHVTVNHPSRSLLSDVVREITTEDHGCVENQEFEAKSRSERILTPSISDEELEDFDRSSSNLQNLVCGLCDEQCRNYEDLKLHYKNHASGQHTEEMLKRVAQDIGKPNEAVLDCLPVEPCNPKNPLCDDSFRIDAIQLRSLDMSGFTANPLAKEMATKLTRPKVTRGCAKSAVTSLTSSCRSQMDVYDDANEVNQVPSTISTEDVSSVSSPYECQASTSSAITSISPADPMNTCEVGRNGKRLLPFARGSKEWRDYRKANAKEYYSSREDLCCPLCSYTAKYHNKLKLHMDTVHQRGRFHCMYCSESLDSLQEKRKHEAATHPLVHQCEQCGYQSKIKSYVDRHIRNTHLTVIKCTVPGCSQSFSKYKLRAHLISNHSSHSTECSTIVVDRISAGDFGCPHCDHREKSSGDIDDHIERVHTIGIKCPLGCPSSFAVGDLDMHIRTMHADDHIFAAAPRVLTRRAGKNVEESTSCSVSYLTPTETSVAESTITTESIVEDNLDTNNSDSESHDDNDDDDNYLPQPTKRNILGSLVCSYCNKTFKENYRLRKHIDSVHLNPVARSRPKKYSCPVSGCDKSFAAPTLLQDHIFVHQGVAAYNCSHCNQSFAARARFAVHLKRYHSVSIKTYDQLNRALGGNIRVATSQVAQSCESTSGRLTIF